MIKVTERELYLTKCLLHMKGFMSKHRSAMKESLNCSSQVKLVYHLNKDSVYRALMPSYGLELKQFQFVIEIIFVVHGRR